MRAWKLTILVAAAFCGAAFAGMRQKLPVLCGVQEVAPWQRIGTSACQFGVLPTHTLSTNFSGGLTCTMAFSVTLSGGCGGSSGTGTWGLQFLANPDVSTTTPLPNLSPNPPTLNVSETGQTCTPVTNRQLFSRLFQGAWGTTPLDVFWGVWKCTGA